jgi:hypothetical protein
MGRCTHTDHRIATMVTMPPIGALLVLVGIVPLFSATACSPRGIVTLLAGGLLLLWAGDPYSGVLLGVLAVVAVLMGGVHLEVLGSLRARKGRVRHDRARILQPYCNRVGTGRYAVGQGTPPRLGIRLR